MEFETRRMGLQVSPAAEEVLVPGRDLKTGLGLPEHREFGMELQAEDVGEFRVRMASTTFPSSDVGGDLEALADPSGGLVVGARHEGRSAA